MRSANLLRPVLDAGIRSVNFFNGRLLTAEDLSREQDANRESRRLLGQAIGQGVAYGLEVSKAAGSGSNAVVTVQAGLAINRNGVLVQLPVSTNLSLVRPEDDAGGRSSAFDECQPFQAGVYVTGSGVYLLTVRPAQGTEGRASVSGLQNSSSDCNTKYLVDGVQFRLVQLDFTANELNDSSRLQSRVASRCFGLAENLAALADPFGPPRTSYGLLDGLRPNRLTHCEVPLAVLFWTATGGIQFIDLWSVRRTLTPRRNLDWTSLVSERRASETEAMLYQFEEQIDALRTNETDPSKIAASSCFVFLPAAGVIPLATSASPAGFNPLGFFGARASRSIPLMEADSLRGLIAESLAHEPIYIDADEAIQLYLIRENIQAAAQGAQVQPVVVFAKHSLGYRGVARFGRARFSLDRFAPFVI
jgi:hypothetical protein